jgi:hypothetical protein
MNQTKLDEFADEAADLASEALHVASLHGKGELQGDDNAGKVRNKFQASLDKMRELLPEVK